MTATTYRISGVVLESRMRLPELPAAAAPPEWRFSRASGRMAPAPPAWFREWRDGKRRVASFARLPAGYLVRFHGYADFAVDCTGRRIVCWARRSATPATIRHLLLDQVMPLALGGERRLVLHAAAVATPSGAVAFVGATGAGKSTLAAALATAGFPLLTDDCLVLEASSQGLLARPFYPGVRLWPDSVSAVSARARTSGVAHYTRKRRLAADRVPFRDEPLPLSRLFVMKAPVADGAPPQPFAVRRLRGREALLEILACTFQLDTGDAGAARAAFELQSRVVETLPVHALSYPWRLSSLADTCRAIGSVLRNGSG